MLKYNILILFYNLLLLLLKIFLFKFYKSHLGNVILKIVR